MIEDVYNVEGIYDLFKKYNGVTEDNCFFYALYEKPITPAEVAAAVFLTGAVNAVGSSIIGVQKKRKNVSWIFD